MLLKTYYYSLNVNELLQSNYQALIPLGNTRISFRLYENVQQTFLPVFLSGCKDTTLFQTNKLFSKNI